MTYIKPNDEWRVDGGASSGIHDSRTCNCDLCVAADEYKRRKKEKINMDKEFDFENVLCAACSYPLDNEGYCVINTDHRGIYPSGDKSRDLAATAAQLISIGYKREQRAQALKTLAEAGVFSGWSQSPNDKYEARRAQEVSETASKPENVSEGVSGSLWASSVTVRTALMDVIDGGDPNMAGCIWFFYESINGMNIWSEDFANQQRVAFADAVLRRITELQHQENKQ